MTVSNGIHLPDLSEFEWVANFYHDHTTQSRDIMKMASTASGTGVLDSGKSRI